MKKTLLLLCLIAGSIGYTFAQAPKIGIKAGINFSSLAATSSGYTITSSNTTGFHLGLTADFKIGEQWIIQPGALYSTKGGTYGITGGADEITLNYIEVPVNAIYNTPTGSGNFFFGGGLYLGYGVSGKEKLTGTATSTGKGTESYDVTYGSTNNDFKNPDVGVNILAGYKLKTGLSFGIGYNLGISNLSNDNSVNFKNNVTTISVGFTFL